MVLRLLASLLRVRRRHLARELVVFILKSRIKRRPTNGVVPFYLCRIEGQFMYIDDNLLHGTVRGAYWTFYYEQIFNLGVLQPNKNRYVYRGR
jgi:hypothetical protein